jgi:crotonobetaine/carnitine-CoA ligase
MGVVCPEVTIRIVDEAGNVVDDDQTGEILARGPGMMRGYLNRPDATNEAIGDGWLRTGDLGRRDANGLLYFAGRRKDIIRRAGENVAAFEVEDVLREHPSVVDAAVVAVPDDTTDEEIMAFVVPAEGAHVDPEELASFCAERLADFKVPRYVAFRNDLPRTATMRVRKEDLRGIGISAERTWDRRATSQP